MKVIRIWMFFLPMVLALMFSCKDQPIKVYKIEKGNFSQTIVETGELAAVDTRAFLMPRFSRSSSQMKVIGLLDQGTEVKPGDSIIQLDPTDIKKMIIDLEGELETQEASYAKLLVNQSNSRSEMETNLKNEQATFDLKKLGMEFSRFESDRIRKVKELEFQQAKINHEKVLNRIKQNKIIAANDLKIEKIRVEQIRRELEEAYNAMPKLTIRTPIKGIFQIARNRSTGSMVKIGDQIYSNNNIGNVPDLTRMKVNTTVNETDFFKIKIGQKVNVRLDANPDVIFKGEVSDIGKLCHLLDYKSRQKVFDIEVSILKTDLRLKPGMTVSCEFICSDLKNQLFIPLNCVESTDAGNYIYLKKGNEFVRTEVLTGAVNNTHIVIKGDYQVGQEVVPVSLVEQD